MSDYWKNIISVFRPKKFQTTNEAFYEGLREGICEGIKAFAIHKNGDQVVGCMNKPLDKVLKEVNETFTKVIGKV